MNKIILKNMRKYNDDNELIKNLHLMCDSEDMANRKIENRKKNLVYDVVQIINYYFETKKKDFEVYLKRNLIRIPQEIPGVQM